MSTTSAKPSVGNCRVIVNIEEPKCRNPYFYPAGRALRSTIRADRLKHQTGSPIIMAVEEIPGEQIEYDGEKGKAFIRDRLAEKGYAQLRKDINRHVSASQTILDPAAKGSPLPEEEYTLHSNDDRATWLAHLVRLVDSGMAVVIKGELPTKEAVDNLGVWTKGEFFGFTTKTITKHYPPEKANA